MDKQAIEIDIKTNLVRAGAIFKRSKFLKEWRARYLVLTTNYLYTFTDEKMEEVTDMCKLKELKSYKSYLRKDEEMIPPAFKVRSSDDMLYFCAKDCNEKWSWLVTFERLLDYKYLGPNDYNNLHWVKNRGFDSQIEFENGGRVMPPPPPPVPIKEKTDEEARKDVDEEVEKILKQLEDQQKVLEQRQKELEKRESTFMQEMKRIEEEKQLFARMSLQPQAVAPVRVSEEQTMSRVAQLRGMFENRLSAPPVPAPTYDFSKFETKKDEKAEESIHVHRSRAVFCLFEEFRKDAEYPAGFKHIIDFLVNIGGDDKMGYSSFVIMEGKSHPNRLTFSQYFIRELTNFVDYERCQNLMKFIEICVFQIPGLFNMEQVGVVHRKLKDIFQSCENDDTLALILKNMFILHRIQKYRRDDIFHKLDRLVKEVKNEETRNWARKLRDML